MRLWPCSAELEQGVDKQVAAGALDWPSGARWARVLSVLAAAAAAPDRSMH